MYVSASRSPANEWFARPESPGMSMIESHAVDLARQTRNAASRDGEMCSMVLYAVVALVAIPLQQRIAIVSSSITT